jgi:hypothetical protein
MPPPSLLYETLLNLLQHAPWQVDPHWFRGHSYARIGWNWIRRAAARGEALIGRLALLTAHDPEPARASRRQVDRSRWMDDLPQRYIFLIPTPSTS